MAIPIASMNTMLANQLPTLPSKRHRWAWSFTRWQAIPLTRSPHLSTSPPKSSNLFPSSPLDILEILKISPVKISKPRKLLLALVFPSKTSSRTSDETEGGDRLIAISFLATNRFSSLDETCFIPRRFHNQDIFWSLLGLECIFVLLVF